MAAPGLQCSVKHLLHRMPLLSVKLFRYLLIATRFPDCMAS